MPMIIEYTKDGDGVVYTNKGETSMTDIRASLLKIYQDKGYPKLKYWIRDISKAENIPSDFSITKELGELEKRESVRNPGIITAIVIGNDHTYALASLFKAYAQKSPLTIEIFQTRELAEEWIFKTLKSREENINFDSEASNGDKNGSGNPVKH